MDTNLLTKTLVLVSLCYGVLSIKHIRWGEDPCILIDIDAYNNLEWIDRNGSVTVATNFSFDDVDITEGGCDLLNPWVGGLWQDGKGFELVFYNNSGTADVQMNIYYNPNEVFKHNLSERVRNIVSFPTCSVGKAYRCQTPVSHVTKVHVGKEAYRYSFGVNTILIQGFEVNGQKYSKVEECPQDMTSSKKSSISTSSTPSSTHSSSQSTHSSSHSTHSISHSTHPSSHSTHPSSHSTKSSSHPSSHSTSHSSTHSTSHSIHSSKSTHPSSHSTPSTKSSTHSTHQSTHSTHPSTHSTHSSSHSTHPSSNPTTNSTTVTPAPIPDDPSKAAKQIFNTKCMKVIGEFQLNISYPSTISGTNKTAIFSVNDINSVNGSCGNSTIDVLYVTFYTNWQMNITVKRENAKAGTIGDDVSRSEFWWSHVYLKYFHNTTSSSKNPFFPNIDPKIANGIVTVSKSLRGEHFKANINGSYMCQSVKTIDLGYGSSFIVSNLQYNAFQANPNNTFSNIVTECSEDKKHSKGNTYIYVGAGLGVLVAMVMVVYVAGRCCYRKNYEEL